MLRKESYLIPTDKWLSLRPEVCQILQLPLDGKKRLQQQQEILDYQLEKLHQTIQDNEPVRMDVNDELIISPKGKIHTDLILNRWDDLLRVVGSLKFGWVTSSLFIGKLQSFPQQNGLLGALLEYGRLVKTNFILRYLSSEDYRRRINIQLNKGEKLHDLRRFLFFAYQGFIRQRQSENLANQSACLTLVTNAVVAWNTVYMHSCN